MDKKILVQYTDMREEIKELRDKIERMEQQIEQMEKGGSVKDSVKGGDGGIQHFVVEGFPFAGYDKKVNLLKKRKLLLEIREIELLELLSKVEDFINSVSDSHMRRIINLKVIDDLTWQQVALRMGGGNTADGVRMTFNRFME